ncbi:LysR substrate-binding domain-containing protein [Variovorax rhizosphaerae]|uniref:LysR substrate-binding domain-containing protein n=1 Tax=Variovorax rhizosphaerae TaxID=1836200 RepID=A0ABU8WHH9_9BURK
MDLKQLQYFVRVAELGSFTRASAVLDIAQPALSRQVRMLEVELRLNLLTRNGRGVTTTEAGRLLLEHGRGILHQVARMREELGRVHGALAGRVSLGLPPSVAKALTVPLTREFRKRLPSAALSVSEGLSTYMQESLLTGRLDIALLYNPIPSPDLEIAPLMEEELFLIGRRSQKASAKEVGAARTLADVAKLPLVIPTRPNAIRMHVEMQMAEIGCRPNIALEIDGITAILDLVADGAGYAILPRHSLRTSDQPQAFVVHPIVQPSLRSKLSIAIAANRPSTLTQKAMVELLRDVTALVFSGALRNTTA